MIFLRFKNIDIKCFTFSSALSGVKCVRNDVSVFKKNPKIKRRSAFSAPVPNTKNILLVTIGFKANTKTKKMK